MNRKTRSYLTIALLSLTTVTLTYQAYSISRLNEKITELEQKNSITSIPENPDTRALIPAPVIDHWGTGHSGNYDPFANMRQMQQQMDQLLSSMFQGERTFSTTGVSINAATPAISVNESKDRYQVVIEIPTDGEVELATELEDNVMRLTGSVSYQGSSTDNSLASSFSSRSQFSRAIPLSKPVDPLGLSTEKQDGRIIISVRKA